MRVTRRKTLLIATAAAIFSSWVAPTSAADEPDEYKLETVSTSLSTTQAGAHPDFGISFQLSEKEEKPYAQTRDIEFRLPAGMIGNPQAIPRCTVGQLGLAPEESKCPVDSQVGITEVTVGGTISGTFSEPIYNMPAPKGSDIVARFGFFAALYPAFINVRLNPIDYSVVATLEGAPSAAGLRSATSTLWGIPASTIHDEERLTPFEAINNERPAGGRPATLPPAPFMTNPTDCSMTRELTVTARSYQLPGQPSTMSAPFPPISGCGNLTFEPRFTALPTNPEAFAPTGLDATLAIPQDETPQGRATSTLKSAVVSLPEGMTINPAAGDGLQACSAEQVGFETAEPPQCPDAAKIGSAEVEVPALADTLHGSVYQRTPEPGNLFRFWLVTDEQGVLLKLPAQIETDPETGQVTTVFSGLDSLGGLPQVPVAEFRLHVFGGPRAPLATPGCGTYQTSYSFTPWSGRPAAQGQTPMEIKSGCGKGGFAPTLKAGSVVSSAGSFSPFALTLTRQDGEANPKAISVTLPQGLLAKLGGVPLCSDADATAGACPAASKIGSITAATGVGGAPLWIPQPGKAPTAVYLAGPYKGAPYSVVSVVPAQAGPFDLGLVVNRAAIYLNPETAVATITTDPLPQILEGVPVTYRTLHVDVDRPEFTLNPTNCDPKQIGATIVATDGQVAQPSAGYQVTNCAKLNYTPKLKLRFTGSTKRTGNPGVKAVLNLKAGQANATAATAILPGSLFIDNSHINNPCTRVQFNAEACPKGSILGTIEAKTPLLEEPFKGNLYFRSNGGERELPDIVADLRGTNGIRVIQVAFIDSVKGRVRTRFLSIPDVPLSRVALTFFAGKRSLLENSENLCKTSRRANIRLVAQNGLVQATTPVIGAKCGKPQR
jgi:hypothetical protein